MGAHEILGGGKRVGYGVRVDVMPHQHHKTDLAKCVFDLFAKLALRAWLLCKVGANVQDRNFGCLTTRCPMSAILRVDYNIAAQVCVGPDEKHCRFKRSRQCSNEFDGA